MQIAIVYHINKNYKHLVESLKALDNQTDKDFELIILNDNANDKIIKIVDSQLDSSKIKKITYYNFSENLGHSFTFNLALKEANVEYIFYTGSNIILANDFIAQIKKIILCNKPDLISFTNARDDGAINVYDTLTKDCYPLINYSMNNKIVSVKLLNKNKITLLDQHYAPFLFVLDILIKATKIAIIDKKLIKQHYMNQYYTYNLFDVIEQNNKIINEYANTPFYKKHKEWIEYCMIVLIIYVYTLRMYKLYKNISSTNKTLKVAKQWLSDNISNWRTNEVLNNNTRSYAILRNLIRKFKFSYLGIRKFAKYFDNE